MKVTLDDSIFTWAGWNRTLDVQAVNVRVTAPDGEAVFETPEMSVLLSVEALMRGIVAPSRIELFRPNLRIVHYADGRFGIGFRRDPAAALGDVPFSHFSRLAEGGSADGTLAYLTSVEIGDATLSVEDEGLGTTWQTSSVRLSLRRDSAGIRGEMSLRPSTMGENASVTVIGEFQAGDREIDVGIAFEDINPGRFAVVSSQLADLAAMDVAMKGSLSFSLASDGRPTGVEFDVTGGPGTLDLPAPVSGRVALAEMALIGRYDSAANAVDIDRLHVGFGPEGMIDLGQAARHLMPMRSIDAEGRYLIDEKRLEGLSIAADLQGPQAIVTGSIDGFDGALTAELRGGLDGVPISQLGRYWPADWGSDPHRWAMAHLSDGTLVTSDVRATFVKDAGGALKAQSLEGTMVLEGVTVDYLPPMPPVRGTSATAKFDLKRFDLAIGTGTSNGLNVHGGTIALTGLDVRDQYADVDLRIEGPVRRAIELVEHEPLGLARMVGLDPAATGGQAAIQLKLYFIVEHTVTRDQVKVEAMATLTDAAIAKAALGLDLSSGDFRLKADNRGLDLAGDARLGSIEAKIDWRQNFGRQVDFLSRYKVAASLSPAQRGDELKLDFPPFTGGILDGPIDIDLEIVTQADNVRRIDGKIDLTEAALELAAVGWSKAAGVSGTADVEILLQGDRPHRLGRLVIDAGNLEMEATADFIPGSGGLSRLTIDKFRYPGTDLSGTIGRGPAGGWEAVFKGPGFNMVPLLDDVSDGGEDEPTEKGEPFTLTVDIDTVELGGQRVLKGATGSLAHDGVKWTAIQLSGSLGGDKNWELQLAPGGPGRRLLTVKSSDGGETLRGFDVYENMVGGDLLLTGEYDDSQPGFPLTGRLIVTDFRVRDAPVIARLVTVMALTGILETLRGQGIGFSELSVPFTFHRGELTVTDATAKGVALGFTASGKIFRRENRVGIEGTAVPAYLLNSLLGGIPLIGSIFTGGDAGGGVFAATYEVTGEIADPKVSVNPLSVLAPGIVRRLFSAFGSLGGGAVPPPPEPSNE